MLKDFGRDISQLFLIIPDLVKEVQVGLRKLGLIHDLCVA